MDDNDIDAILNGARKHTAKVPLCLRTDLVAEYESLEQRVAEAKAAGRKSLAGPEIPLDVTARMGELRNEIKAATVTFEFRPVSPERWDELLIKFPARRDEHGSIVLADKGLGINTAGFFRALMPESCLAPRLTPERWVRLLGEDLTPTQYMHLAGEVWDLNTRDTQAPFLRAVSETNPASGNG